MGDRGRTPAAELAVVRLADVQPRLDPPESLGPEQVAEWDAVVNRLPAEWFPRETLGLLEGYCNHVVAARQIAEMSEKYLGCENFDIKEFKQLRQMYELETRAASSLATRMRITQQTTYDKSKKKGSVSRKPWE